MAGVQRVRDGNLETPIAYPEADEFRPASLNIPQAPLTRATFQLPAFLLGAVLLLGLEALSHRRGRPAAQQS